MSSFLITLKLITSDTIVHWESIKRLLRACASTRFRRTSNLKKISLWTKFNRHIQVLIPKFGGGGTIDLKRSQWIGQQWPHHENKYKYKNIFYATKNARIFATSNFFWISFTMNKYITQTIIIQLLKFIIFLLLLI